MRVFARYLSENGLNFRLNTVLQFGDSWTIIGATVLINPGSAKPIKDVNGQENHWLSQICHKEDSWFEFSPDSTMRQLEKIFNGWYVGNEKPLDGVILLFNLFNLRDQNLNNALSKQKICQSKHLFISDSDIDLLKGINKVYLGWGKTIRSNKELSLISEKIFSHLYTNLKYYLSESFDDNPFYHPGFINRSFKRNIKTQNLISSFSL